MKRRSLYLVLASIIVLSLALSVCAAPTAAPAPAEPAAVATEVPAAEAPPAEAPAEAPAAGELTFVLVPKHPGNPYFDKVDVGAKEAAGELGDTVLFQGSASSDVAGQIELVDSLIAQDVDAIAVSANDADALVPIGKEAMDAGIQFVSWDLASRSRAV